LPVQVAHRLAQGLARVGVDVLDDVVGGGLPEEERGHLRLRRPVLDGINEVNQYVALLKAPLLQTLLALLLAGEVLAERHAPEGEAPAK
jgi:hypothetical protein